jgi:hypothetical protein
MDYTALETKKQPASQPANKPSRLEDKEKCAVLCFLQQSKSTIPIASSTFELVAMMSSIVCSSEEAMKPPYWC